MLAVFALSHFAVFHAAGQVLIEDFKLLASDGAVNDFFGNSIAINNGIVAVGVSWDDDNGGRSGSAYLFDAANGVQLFKLLPSDGAAEDLFGHSIGISDGIVVVGAYKDDDNGSAAGSAYLFDASTGEQLLKLIPNDATMGDLFGWSVAISNGIVAIGAILDDENGLGSGSAYLFNAATGSQLFKLLPNDAAAGDSFGHSIAITDNVIAVGANYDDDNGDASGSVYLFDTTTGTQIAKLVASDGGEGDEFGWSVALANGIVAVGSPQQFNAGAGAAYLFDVSTGAQIAKLLASDGAGVDQFGYSIGITTGCVAVGAYKNDDNGGDSGSAYLFETSIGTQIFKLLPSDGATGDWFGRSIAINNGLITVGAIHDDDNGDNSGSAYVFTVPAPCPADLTGEGILDFFDISAFLAAFVNYDPIADFTNDAIYDFFDVSAFLQAFAQGCP